MNHLLDDIQTWAQELGATHARVVIDRAVLVPQDVVREACLQNSCGSSGRCWTCPPDAGELADLAPVLAGCADFVVVQSITVLEDSWDFEGAKQAAVDHNARLRDLRRRLAAEYPDRAVLVLGCGGCGFCPSCTCPDAPCRFPAEALSSVEAYGLDVKALLESVDLSYVNGKGTVSYVGAVLVC